MTDERAATNIDVKIGHRVRARRLEIGMSQERLSEALGLTFQQVQKYERGVNRIACSRIIDIAKALDAPVAYFFEGLEGNAKARADDGVQSMLATPEGARMASLFAQIKSRPVRQRVLNLAEAVAGEA
jgi:transcriptional regulator with XRE-family HTH domain